MKDKVALWKQRICDRKAKGQTIIDWCEEHNITKGSYHYWRKQVKHAESQSDKSIPFTKPIAFANVKAESPVKPTIQVTWQDVNIQFANSQEALLAAEMISHLRQLC